MKITDYQGLITGLFVLVLLLAACVISAAAVWFALPREQPVSLGSIDDLNRYEPNYAPVSSDLAVFLIHTEEDIVAWSAISPRSGCRVQWVESNNRFEDPCCGGKWCADGQVADRRYRGMPSLARYEIEITRSGEILLYPWRMTEGQPLPEQDWVADSMDLLNARIECPSIR